MGVGGRGSCLKESDGGDRFMATIGEQPNFFFVFLLLLLLPPPPFLLRCNFRLHVFVTNHKTNGFCSLKLFDQFHRFEGKVHLLS